MKPNEGGQLRRELGLLDVAAIHVGNILGSGIFVAPAAVAAATSSGMVAVGLWIAGGVVATCGGACYAENGSRLPRAGGFYVYYREVYGPAVAFVGGWAALLVTYPASIAAIALVFAAYLGELAPALAPAAVWTAAGAVLLSGLLNVLGVRLAAWVQRLLTGSKVLALTAVCLAAAASLLTAGAAGADAVVGTRSPTPFPIAPAALLGALVALLWTYDGWSDIGMIAGEVRDPRRVLGRAVLLGSAVLVVTYSIVQVSVSVLLPPERAAASSRVLADAVEAGLGPGANRLVALLVVLCTFGSVHGVTLASSRLGFAMARDGVFPSWFAAVAPRFGTPSRSVGAVLLAALVYVFATGFRNLLALFSFSVWIFYGLTAAALIVLRRRGIGSDTAWIVPGGPVIPGVLILTGACMTVGLMAENPARSLLGLGLLLAGFPAYALWQRFGETRSGR